MRRMIALGACALLASCLEVEQTVTLRADGSGTQRLKLGITERGLNELRTRAAMDAALTDPAKIFDERSVQAELADAGLVCKEVRSYHQRQRRFIEVEAGFRDWDSLRASPLGGGSAEWRLEPGPSAGTLKLVMFPRGELAWTESRKKARELRAAPGDREARFLERGRQEIRGLRLKWILNLPGDVKSHSRGMEATSSRQVVAEITDADVRTVDQMLALMAPRFEVVFDARRCSLPVARRR